MSEAKRLNLVVLETAHIQQYIFNSNRLKDNIGASYLVAAATEAWVKDLIMGSNLAHNLNIEGDFTSLRIESDNLSVEVLYCGGGNSVLLFQEESDAKWFISTLSKKILLEAPGLRVTFHRTEVDWETQALSHAVSDALKQLRQERSKQQPRNGIAGLGVTAMCAATS